MNGNSALKNGTEEERCAELLINEIRALLLLSLKYVKGENADFILSEKYLREGLDKLSQLEEAIST